MIENKEGVQRQVRKGVLGNNLNPASIHINSWTIYELMTYKQVIKIIPETSRSDENR